MRVGDIARQLDETEVTIRYWCDKLRVPVRRVSGQRFFDPVAQARIAEIHRLVRIEGHTLAGAKRKLRA